MHKWRIVQVVGSAGGGMAHHVSQVCQILAAEHQVIAVAGSQITLPPGVHHIPVEAGARPGISWIRAILHLRRVAGGADVVHAHGLRAGFLASLALGGHRSVPLVVTLHSLPPTQGLAGKASSWQWALVRRRAAAVLSVSTPISQWAMGGPEERDHQKVAHGSLGKEPLAERALIPVPPPVATEGSPFSLERFGLSSTQPLVVTVARLAPQKGIEFLIRSAAQLAKSRPEAQWVVVGDGPLEHLAHTAPANVHFVGRSSEVPHWLRQADIVVNTSSSEGQPVVVQEALHLGCVIVATDVGGTSEVTQDAAELVPYGDEMALVGSIERFLDDPVAAEEMRMRAKNRAQQLPTNVSLHQQLSSVYQRVIE